MSSHRIKLVLSGHLRSSVIGGTPDSKVVDVAPSMTLEGLVATVVVQEMLNGKEKTHNIALSTGDGRSVGSNNKTIDWKTNPTALVRDVIPKQSSVVCEYIAGEGNVTSNPDSKSHTNDANQSNDNQENHPKPAEGEARPSKKAKKSSTKDVIDLTSDDESNNGSGNQKVNATSKHSNKTTSSASSTLDDPRDPTTVTTDDYWIFQQGPARFRQEDVLGKWLVFRGPDAITDTWKSIAKAVQTGELLAVTAKVATHYNSNMDNPFASNNGQKTKKKQQSYVICVYTSQSRMDQVGRRLIAMVQHDIRYKTDEMTMNGVYANTNSSSAAGTKASMKTLYWNQGNPDTVRKLWTMTESLKRARKAAKEKEASLAPFDKVQVTVKALHHHYYQKKNKSSPRRPDVTNQPVQLERERTNTYDSNAIFVVLPSNVDSPKLGYLAKEHAAILAPWMDRSLIHLDGSTVVSVASNQESAILELKGRAHPQAQEMWQCLA